MYILVMSWREEISRFFQTGRSAFVLIAGIILLILGVVAMKAAMDSREAVSADPGWARFVAASGTNQWVSGSFLIAGACIVMSINYLPRLEGEA